MKRLLALTGSVVLGTLGAVALGSPAQAHHNTITAGAVCANGKIQINWTIQNSEGDKNERIIWFQQNPSDSILRVANNGTVTSDVIGVQSPIGAGAALKGVQTVPDGTPFAEIKMKAKWSNNYVTPDDKIDSYKISLADLNCESGFSSAVAGTAECDKESGTWKVTWQVSNQHPSRAAKVQIVTDGTVSERTAVSTGGTFVTLSPESLITDLADNDPIAAATTLSAHQTVPGTADAARLKVELTWQRDNFAAKQHTSTATVNFTGGCVKNAPKPAARFASDCTGLVTVTLFNGDTATKDARFVVKGANGWSSEEVVVPKGETALVHVPKENSASVVVLESGEQIETYSWQDSTNCHPIDIKITQSCAGVEVTVDNPENGAAHTVKLVPTSGQSITKVFQPGEKATYTFDAPNDTDAFKVDVSIGERTRTITWERPKGCEELDGNIEQTCTGIIIHLTNPQDGSPAALVLTPTPGDPVSFTLNPGEDKDVEFVAGPSGLTVAGSLNGETLGEPLVWVKPEGCVPPQLPKTGDNTAGYIASGTGLVALGAIVFFLARRRMVNLRRLAS
ncbi:hypothetical protein Rhe02_25420 [Rhizocola hellebori]|uniref:Gram-positive cocci surface proteins LPxTG domain-containing protein n=1 Tax=Rhizocola hellebori TaxID=1392758 RepID=A0A8J3Q7F5_9ACTN|nr:hypothetical protein Rhe02_25420 [Rhizocola hellebori]